MTNSASILRLTIAAALIVSVAKSGSPTCFYNASICGTESRAPASHHRCCCGAECGGKCGMACCRPSAPSQDRPAAPVKLIDEFGPAWGLVAAAPETIDPPATQRGGSVAEP